VFTRYRYARCVDNVGLDAACPQPARQPETIPAGLEGNCNAFEPKLGEHKLCKTPANQCTLTLLPFG
jgi:hypothetical protein